MNKKFKVVVNKKHTVDEVEKIIEEANPRTFILESSSKLNNLKTLHIAQELRIRGCKELDMKFYKGELFKVIFSRKPRRSRQRVGEKVLPDIDSRGEDETRARDGKHAEKPHLI